MTRDPLVPFRRLGPRQVASPLVLAVPHAGQVYPASLLTDSAVPFELLQQLEDRHADRLIAGALADGAMAIVARPARAWIDLNRAPDEVEDPLDPAKPSSARVRSGLGLIPSRLNGRPLWRRPPSPEMVADRLAGVHEPYHQAIAQALATAADHFGHAVLVDCHSMPTLRGASPVRVVIGDLHGRSASRKVTQAALAAVRDAGWPAALNSPYAGAYTLRRHGSPGDRADAIQVEIDRALYLDRSQMELSSGVARVSAMLAGLCRAVIAALPFSPALAAE